MTNEPLLGALRLATLHPLLMIVSKVLTRSGFGDIQMMGRRHEKQKSSHYGFELQCTTTVGNLACKVIVKVTKYSVRVRMLDEIAGVADRTGADLALIISTKHITRFAKEYLPAYKTARIEVIDGEMLAELLTRYRIGVRPSGSVDYAFFEELERLSPQINNLIAKNR